MYMQADLNVEEDEDSQVTFGGREGIIFAIDAQASMLDENEGKEANLRLAMKAIEASMRNLIVSNQKDLVGIVFYNTVHSPKSRFEAESVEIVVPANMCILLPMDTSSVENITYVRNFHESDDLFDFSTRYGSCSDAKFAEMLWLCMRMFQKCGYKLQSSAIVLFTDCAQPHPPNSHEQQQAFVKAKDLNQLDVEFTLIPMQEDFDPAPFYREFICTAMDIDMEHFELEAAVRDIEAISSRIYKRNFRKRCNTHLKFHLGDDLELSVGVYSSVRHVKYPKALMVHRNTNEIITRKRVQEIQNTDDGTTVPLLPHQQKKCQEIGGKNIVFTTQELATMKTLLPAGIRLLGFKPRSSISICNYLKHGAFLYPDEMRIAGSTKLFRALWKRCLDRQKVAICVLTLRHKATPGYVALVPQDNAFHDGDQLEYNGFLIVHLPNRDDVRDFDAFNPEETSVTAEKNELFENMVRKLKFRYNPKDFNDPALRNIYSTIEAFAFKTEREEQEDTTLPNTEYQDSKIADIVSAIAEEFGQLSTITKRKAVESSGNVRKSARTTQDGPPAADEAAILEEFRNGREEKLTVSTLRSYLQQLGISGISGAKKAVLIDKIKAHHDL
ncbi:ATP-dependent DNA helicase 2 subunit 1 [Lutzomyia longipalpis]|uniref:ATP-dependent DNA helicase 2 subunit 1 n=1 Tax=Lutzomyia longipalpis TaxID=7200 RepID=UPI0024841FF9|nr:ATP-dependent DNA helicase 2 subunit 1 [Lutzomyia longipalpis]XP_055692612.1 ATP-dependent DNA helicase 2 subunit 1 [Lutzomyia longipalpis]